MKKLSKLAVYVFLLSILLFPNGNAVSNGGFETAGGGGADVFANWTESTAGSSSINDETSDVHGGSHACRMDVDASNNTATIYQIVTLTTGVEYTLIIWYKMSTSGKTAQFMLANTMSNVWLKSDGTWQSGVPIVIALANKTSWYGYSISFTASSYTDYVLTIQKNSAASSSVYFDDVSITLASGHNVILKPGVKLILKPGVKEIIKEQ